MIGCRWNGYPNNWGGGHPGDGKIYSQTALVSEVKITPFNDPNDIMYMSIDDQPTGCEPPVIHQGCTYRAIASACPGTVMIFLFVPLSAGSKMPHLDKLHGPTCRAPNHGR